MRLMHVNMVWLSPESLSDGQCSLNEDVRVCVCSTHRFPLSGSSFVVLKLWTPQEEGRGEGPAQLHGGRGRAVRESLKALGMK